MVTPFREGAIDHASLAALRARLRGHGVAAFVACGSTGEAAALDAPEQRAVLESVLAAAQDLPIVMGLSGCHLGQVREQVKALAAYALAGLLVQAPHYIRPSQEGLLHWFHALADDSHVPVVLYDNPYRTGATLTAETLLTLAAHRHIHAIKDCAGDTAKTQAVIPDGRLSVLAGEDAQIFTTLAWGGHGAMAPSRRARRGIPPDLCICWNGYALATWHRRARSGNVWRPGCRPV